VRATPSRYFDLLNRLRMVSTAPAGGGSGWASRCAYDDIGNRTASKDGGDDSGLGLRSSAYTRNSLNQYTGRANAPFVDVVGLARAGAAVTVNGVAAARRGEYFRRELGVTNADGPAAAPRMYDGWACLAELNAGNNAYIAGYAWGLDLSGTTTGAGGVGGLLWIRPSGGVAHFAAHDNNGNVIGLVDVLDQAETRPHDVVDHEAGVPEADGLKAALADDQAVMTDPPVDAGMELIRTAAVVGVQQDQFHVPFVERPRLLGAPEAQEVLLEAAPGGDADALFFRRDGDPVVFPQSRDEAGRRHERVSVADALHRSQREDAGGVVVEVVIGQGRRLEVRHGSEVHAHFSVWCRRRDGIPLALG
jgi:hypothetical protein